MKNKKCQISETVRSSYVFATYFIHILCNIVPISFVIYQEGALKENFADRGACRLRHQGRRLHTRRPESLKSHIHLSTQRVLLKNNKT
jgi:hypothetical protein